MQVRTGYSEDVSHNNWIKGDIYLDSSDLEDLAVGHGFDLAGLTLAQKYGILSLEAERLLTAKYMRDIQIKAPGSRDMELLKKRFENITSKFLEQINLVKRLSDGRSGTEIS
jgi:hypothetical protein